MKKLRIAIQGQDASFHDVAARNYFGNDVDIINCKLPFKKVFEELQDDNTDFAVCAIENSIYGVINDVYDLLIEYKPWICGEIYLRIEQCLIGLNETKIEAVKEIYSHPVALAQCEKFIEDNFPDAKLVETHDTAGSVEKVVKMKDPTKVAIASSEAAELHGAKVLKGSIETNHQNYTRFMVISKNRLDESDTNKTSIVAETPNEMGSLYKLLGFFVNRGIDLKLITSRPIIGKPQSYMFYIDFAAGLSDERSKEAIDEAKRMGYKITLLGSYKMANLEN